MTAEGAASHPGEKPGQLPIGRLLAGLRVVIVHDGTGRYTGFSGTVAQRPPGSPADAADQIWVRPDGLDDQAPAIGFALTDLAPMIEDLTPDPEYRPADRSSGC